MESFPTHQMGLVWRTSPGKQSQKVHRHRTGKISPTACFSPTLLLPTINGITPTGSTATGPIGPITLIGGTSSSPKRHHYHHLLIVAAIKHKQITITIRNELAVSVVMENSQLVVTGSNLIPIGD
jgi:hypothetical protein